MRVNDAEFVSLRDPAERQIQNLAVARDVAIGALVHRNGNERAVDVDESHQRLAVELAAGRVHHPVLADAQRFVFSVLVAQVVFRRAAGRDFHDEIEHLPRAPDEIRPVFQHLRLVHADGDEAVRREVRPVVPVHVIDEIVAADHHVVPAVEPRRDGVFDV